MAVVEGQIGEHARALAARGAAKGGKARAARLTPAQRRESARRAAEARWVGPDGRPLPRATYHGVLDLGGTAVTCAVLEDETRLINQQTFLKAIGRAEKAKGGRGSRRLVDGDAAVTPADQAVAGLPPFLAAANLAPYVSDELRSLAQPVQFRTERGVKSYGYDAKLLPKVCEVYLQARREGTLLESQERIARQCEILQGALATVGIIALIDEVTGYQEVRDRNALQQILDAYVTEEMRPWVPRFPTAFFEQCYRLLGWRFDPKSTKRNQYIGKVINTFVYEPLPKGVLPELRRLNPVLESGRRRHKHHQFLTEDIGDVHLQGQIVGVITLMRASDTWTEFAKLFSKVYADRYREPLQLPAPPDDVPPSPASPNVHQGTLW